MKNAADTARSDIYLRGVPDNVIQAGQLYFGVKGGTAYKRALQSYTDALKGSVYGWLGINPATTPRGTVTQAVQNLDGTVTFTVLSTNGVPIPASLEPVPVKFSGINRGKSILNRQLMVRVINPTTLTTVNQVAFTSFDTQGKFIAQVRGFIPYDHYGYVKLASRKTGKPFGVGRGRLPAQTLH